MGCGGSKPTAVDSEASERNNAIENQLKRDKMQLRCVFHLVVQQHTDETRGRNEIKMLVRFRPQAAWLAAAVDLGLRARAGLTCLS